MKLNIPHDRLQLWDNAHVIVSESSSARTSSPRELLLVVNCDLEAECMDSELRVALQWMAASELGLPAFYLRKSKEMKVAKVGTQVRRPAVT